MTILPFIVILLLSLFHSIDATNRDTSLGWKTVWALCHHIPIIGLSIFTGYMFPDKIVKRIYLYVLPLFFSIVCLYYFICLFKINIFQGSDAVMWGKIWNGIFLFCLSISLLIIFIYINRFKILNYARKFKEKIS